MPDAATAVQRDVADDLVDPVDESSPLGDRLIAAAAEVFAEKGYDRAGVQEIARRAGVTTGAIYSRHRGKADLLVEAVRVHCTGPLDDLERTGLGTDAVERLEAAGAHVGSRDVGLGQALLLEAMVAARRDPELRAVLAERVSGRRSRLADTIAAAQEGGSIDAALDPHAIVQLTNAIALGHLLLDVVGLDRPAPDAWNDLVHRLVEVLGDPSPDAPPHDAPPHRSPPRGER